HRRDDLEAAALYELLEQKVAPKFYERDEHGTPQRWVEMVRHTLEKLGPKVLASRMVRDYTVGYYAPAAKSLRATVGADGSFAPAKELARYRERVQQVWPSLVITEVDSSGLPDTPLLGSPLTLTASVQLAGLAPAEVAVQAVIGRVDLDDKLSDSEIVPMVHTGSRGDGVETFSTTTTLPVSGSVGYTVRVLPHHPLLASDSELGLAVLAASDLEH
ncbi:glycogen phosphorylase domain protein, partial [Mycobacteroides abscessus 3A-0122-R]